jgi:hypothetical protein
MASMHYMSSIINNGVGTYGLHGEVSTANYTIGTPDNNCSVFTGPYNGDGGYIIGQLSASGGCEIWVTAYSDSGFSSNLYIYVSNDLTSWTQIGNTIAVANTYEQCIDIGYYSGGFSYIAVCGFNSGGHPVSLHIDAVDPFLMDGTTFTISIGSIDDGTSWAVPTNVYIDGNYVGTISWDPISFTITYGSVVTFGVDDVIPIPGYYDMYWYFSYFDAGCGGNPTTVIIVDNLSITAHYYNGQG